MQPPAVSGLKNLQNLQAVLARRQAGFECEIVAFPLLRVSELGQGAHVEREIMLVKIQASGYGRDEVKRNTEIFRGQIIDVTPSLYTVQLADSDFRPSLARCCLRFRLCRSMR